MTEYADGRASFLAVPGAQAGFTSFRDNASTRSSIPGFDMYPGPSTLLTPAPESPDDDDVSHYSNDEGEQHHGRRPSSIQNQSYYTANGALSPSSTVRMPEYTLPSPPIPALDREEYGQDAYLSPSGGYLNRSGSRRSVGSQRSYVDEQLKNLYPSHY